MKTHICPVCNQEIINPVKGNNLLVCNTCGYDNTNELDNVGHTIQDNDHDRDSLDGLYY